MKGKGDEGQRERKDGGRERVEGETGYVRENQRERGKRDRERTPREKREISSVPRAKN